MPLNEWHCFLLTSSLHFYVCAYLVVSCRLPDRRCNGVTSAWVAVGSAAALSAVVGPREELSPDAAYRGHRGRWRPVHCGEILKSDCFIVQRKLVLKLFIFLQDGSRRRTTGGVFFHILREDDEITADKKRQIFAPSEEELEYRKEKKRYACLIVYL